MKDCAECQHSIKSYGQLLCRVLNLPKTVSFMRNERSECGPEGMLWEPKKEKKYAQYDD